MSDEFECKGKWWLPGNKKEKFFGVLKFNIVNGGKLEINLKHNHRINTQLYFQKTLILGSTDKGDITLFDCELLGSGPSHGKLHTAKFNFSEGVIGIHVSNKDDFKIQRLAVNYSYLTAWCDSFGIKTLDAQVYVYDPYKVGFPNIKSGSRLLTKTNDFELWLSNDMRRSALFSETNKQITLIETPYIEILLEGKNTLKEYLEFVKSIQYFLSLAMGEQVFPLSFDGTSDKKKPFKFIYRLSSIPSEKTIILANFALSSIENSIDGYLKKWIDNYMKLKSIYELYFSSLNEDFSPELRFSYLIQALEGLHRAVYGNDKYITDEEYRKEGGLYETLVGVIPDSVSSDFKQSLVKGKLFYANEYSLKKRLEEMLSDTYLEIINARKIILEKNQRKDFIDKIVRTRNYYTHPDNDLKDKILEGKELGRAVKLLSALVEIALMSEMGISMEKIKKLRQQDILWLEFRNKI